MAGVVSASPDRPRSGATCDPSRSADGQQAYQTLDPTTRREIAQGLVRICSTALSLAG